MEPPPRASAGWYKFRRQVWIEGFIVDFLCVEAMLVVEADGAQHSEATAEDEARSAILRHGGYDIIRFWNNDIMLNTDGVLTAIKDALLARLPSPSQAFGLGPSLSRREREL